MSIGMVRFGIPIGLAIATIPILIILFVAIISGPFFGFTALFIANYFVIPAMRYMNVTGLSFIIDVMMDIVILGLVIQYIINPIKTRLSFNWFILLAASIWFIYCCLELLNNTADTNAWISSRGLTYYFLFMTLATFVAFDNFKKVKLIIFIYSILTLIGAAKGLMQQFIGFDYAELAFLNAGGAKTHLIRSGIRYFSIYASAGVYGVIMGHALVVFSIVSIYSKNNKWRIYYLCVALAGLYGLLYSGTRGALAVPLAGFFLFTILSKQLKILIPSAILLASVYIFLTMTTIGQGNTQIRRMRTAFDPNEPSLVVRKENQKLFREYLKDKPFGEGLGLSGVDTGDNSRFTTSIPTDSWYVKIWVETGIVGLTLYITIFSLIVLYGSYIILFRIKHNQIRGYTAALLSGVFGLLICSYVTQTFGQYPVALIVYMSIAITVKGHYFEKNIQQNSLSNQII